MPEVRLNSRLVCLHDGRRLRAGSDADPRGSSGSTLMKPRKKAPLAEAIAYIPKILFVELLRDATGR